MLAELICTARGQRPHFGGHRDRPVVTGGLCPVKRLISQRRGDVEPPGGGRGLGAGLEDVRQEPRLGKLTGDGFRLVHDRAPLGAASQRPQAPRLVAECAGSQRRVGVGAWHAEYAVDPVQCVRVAISHQPVPTGCDAHREGLLGAVLPDRPSKGRVKVGDLRVQQRQVVLAAGAPKRAVASVAPGEREKVAVVALADGVLGRRRSRSARWSRRGSFRASPAGSGCGRAGGVRAGSWRPADRACRGRRR